MLHSRWWKTRRQGENLARPSPPPQPWRAGAANNLPPPHPASAPSLKPTHLRQCAELRFCLPVVQPPLHAVAGAEPPSIVVQHQHGGAAGQARHAAKQLLKGAPRGACVGRVPGLVEGCFNNYQIAVLHSRKREKTIMSVTQATAQPGSGWLCLASTPPLPATRLAPAAPKPLRTTQKCR
jgi:hypothetical protein